MKCIFKLYVPFQQILITYRVLPMPGRQTNARYYLFNKANGILTHTHKHTKTYAGRKRDRDTDKTQQHLHAHRQTKDMRPHVIFFATFWFFASHPHLTLFVFVVLFLFFKFSLSLPSSLCSVAVSISCFMQTKTKNTNITPRYVLQPVISICTWVHAYIFIFYRHSV